MVEIHPRLTSGNLYSVLLFVANENIGFEVHIGTAFCFSWRAHGRASTVLASISYALDYQRSTPGTILFAHLAVRYAAPAPADAIQRPDYSDYILKFEYSAPRPPVTGRCAAPGT